MTSPDSSEARDPKSVKELLESPATGEEFEKIADTFLRVNVKGQIDRTDTVVHLAAIEGNGVLMERLASCPNFSKNLKAKTNEDQTPLHFAALRGHSRIVEFLITKSVEELLKSPATGEEFEKAADKLLRGRVLKEKFLSVNLKKTFMRFNLQDQINSMTVIHLAAYVGNRALMERLASCPNFLKNLNARTAGKQTSLHLAALTGKSEIVEFLVTDERTKKRLRGDIEDKLGQTAYEIAVELEWHDTVRLLLDQKDVERYLEEKRFKLTVYGGGINAILVGAALIASITFAGWLQPPLGYQTYYGYPRNATMADAPPDVFEQYATIGEHLTVKVFWISNSLSFYCAIASILAGAAALVPRHNLHELAEGRRLQGAVYLTGFTLSWAVLFVVCAFTAAGYASLPPILKYEVYMIVTLVLGVIVCMQGFIGGRLSDPLALQKLTAIIDPTFYLSKVSGWLEKGVERFPYVKYQSYESRREERRKRYNPVEEEEELNACFAWLPCHSRKKQNTANKQTQQASNGPGEHQCLNIDRLRNC